MATQVRVSACDAEHRQPVILPRINRPALAWTLSRLVVEPITEPIARRTAALLTDLGLHGHGCGIDTMPAAPGPATVLASDSGCSPPCAPAAPL